VSLLFLGFGDEVGVGGAFDGVFAAVEAVGVVDAGGAELAAVLAEGVGGGVGIEDVGADDAEVGAVPRDEDGRVRLASERGQGGDEDED